jgi:hypothetical protein
VEGDSVLEIDAMFLSARTRADYANPFVTVRHPPAVAILGALAVAMYGVSFFLPAAGTFLGFQAFVCALLFIIGVPMWLANPVFWLGLVMLSRREYRSASHAGMIALVLALSECWMFSGELKAGYYVWAGSMAVLALVGLFGEWTDGPRGWYSRSQLFPVGEASRIVSRFRR